jgi:hypothetical protein
MTRLLGNKFNCEESPTILFSNGLQIQREIFHMEGLFSSKYATLTH